MCDSECEIGMDHLLLKFSSISLSLRTIAATLVREWFRVRNRHGLPVLIFYLELESELGFVKEELLEVKMECPEDEEEGQGKL